MKNIVSPNKTVAAQLFYSIAKQLWSSFKYILETTDNQDSNFYDLIQHMDQKEKPSPFFFAAHHILATHYGPSPDLFDKQIVENILNFKDYTPVYKISIRPYYADQTKLQEEVIRRAAQEDNFSTYP